MKANREFVENLVMILIIIPFCFDNNVNNQIKYSMACLQCPTIYAQMDEKTGEAVQISKPIPLPALNVRLNLKITTQISNSY